jgi:hypothetical protein
MKPAAHLGAIPSNVCQLGVLDERPHERRATEVRAAKVRAGDTRSAEISPTEVCSPEVRMVEFRPSEVSSTEVRPTEVCPPERETELALLSPRVPRLDAFVDDCEVFVVRHVPDSGCVVGNRYGRQWPLSIINAIPSRATLSKSHKIAFWQITAERASWRCLHLIPVYELG